MTAMPLTDAGHPSVRVDGAAARGLAQPTALDWLTELARVLGPERALAAWSPAALATGCHGMLLTPDQLGTLGQWLVDNSTEAAVRMAARSCLARLRTYRVLTGAGRTR